MKLEAWLGVWRAARAHDISRIALTMGPTAGTSSTAGLGAHGCITPPVCIILCLFRSPISFYDDHLTITPIVADTHRIIVIFYALVELAKQKAFDVVQDVIILSTTVTTPTKT